MNILPDMVGLLSKEEARNFKLFACRTNNHGNRKDLALFDQIKRSYPDVDEGQISGKLYPGGDKNAYYRLKNRLTEDIGLSLSLLHYNASDISYILNQYLLAKLFIARNKRALTLHYMARAEKRAQAIEAFDLLDVIYNEYVRLSHELLEINPEEYIEKRRANRSKLGRLQEIDDVLAMVIYQVKVSQNFGKSNVRINEMLSRTVNTYANSAEVKNSPLLRFRIYDSVSRILLQQHNYRALEKYLLKSYGEFEGEKLFTKSNHDTKLQMLTYICNALFKNSKLDESLRYAERLRVAMEEFNGLLRHKYRFFYYNILVNNYARNQVEKAIEILNEAKEDKSIKEHPVYIGFVYLNLAVSYFGIRDYRASLRSIVRLYMLESFKKLDEAFRFKIAITELIVRFELGDNEYVEQRLRQAKKEFRSSLQAHEFRREKELLGIIQLLCSTAFLRGDKKALVAVKKFMKGGLGGQRGTEIIDYNEWLHQRVNG